MHTRSTVAVVEAEEDDLLVPQHDTEASAEPRVDTEPSEESQDFDHDGVQVEPETHLAASEAARPSDAIVDVSGHLEDVSPEQAAAVQLALRAASFSEARVRALCESLLLVADKPLTAVQLQSSTGVEPKRIREAMEEIAGRFREGVSGIVLHEVAGGWQLRTCPTNAEDVRRFLQVKPQRLTKAALETIAIIAYRQPVTRPEIEEIRGVDSGAIVKALLDRGLIQVIGKKEEPGRPLLYATTRHFLEHFNLKDLSSLPTLRELHELTEESARIVEDTFPDEPAKAERGIADLVDSALGLTVEDSRRDDESAIEDLDAAMSAADMAVRGTDEALSQTQRSEGALG